MGTVLNKLRQVGIQFSVFYVAVKEASSKKNGAIKSHDMSYVCAKFAALQNNFYNHGKVSRPSTYSIPSKYAQFMPNTWSSDNVVYTCCFVVGANLFTDDQRSILLRYFDEYGMTSTHRRNSELMERCAAEVGTSLERVKVCMCVRIYVQLSVTVFVDLCAIHRYAHFSVITIMLQNWIGSEAVKRKKRAGVLPRPKVDITGVSCTSICMGS